MPHRFKKYMHKTQYMHKVMQFAKAFGRDEKGATAMEYGLIVALLSVALIGSFSLIASSQNSMWSGLSNALEASN